jgi:hypothetical protein
MKMSHAFFACLMALALLATESPGTPAAPLPHRWLYLQTGLLPEAHMTDTMALLERIAAEGYTGVVFNDFKFMRWDSIPDIYRKHWQELHDTCQRLKLELVAAVMPMGYSNSLLSRDPNLAEGLPVRGASFIVRNGSLVPDERIDFRNGSFEAFHANTPDGWKFTDEPGSISFMDTTIHHEGHASLRMQDVAKFDPKHRHARVCQTLHLKPFHAYHVSVAVKTRDWIAEDTRVMVLGEQGQTLNFQTPLFERTQDWKTVDITFNTLDSSTVTLYLGTWAGESGTIWWDDVRIEPAGFMNVLRRQGAPLQLSSEDGTVLFQEGRDVESVCDPILGMDPWAGDYSSWHARPVVRLLPGGTLKEGQRVRADYYHAAIIYDGQVPCCMSEPKVYEILTEHIKQVRDAVHPDGYMMMHDEIRIQGWDDSCRKQGGEPARILGNNVRHCVEIIKAADPGKPLFIWSDMFDPTHNARKSGAYYLVKGEGPWYGAWKDLPSDVTVVSWQMDPKTRRQSMEHFARIGHKQILAGYYDGDPKMIATWLKDAHGIQGVDGVMYTTWQSNFKHTREFVESATRSP